jgi:hypothetical protein
LKRVGKAKKFFEEITSDRKKGVDTSKKEESFRMFIEKHIGEGGRSSWGTVLKGEDFLIRGPDSVVYDSGMINSNELVDETE